MTMVILIGSYCWYPINTSKRDSRLISRSHAEGLMHGDLYAHNILWNDKKVVLSDLGGASFLPLDNPDLTQQLLKLEARALAVLTEELRKCS